MQLSSSDIYQIYRPSPCVLRLYLDRQGVEAAAPGPYQEVIRGLGDRYEQAHRATFDVVRDVSAGSPETRQRETFEAIESAAPVIYQPYFSVPARLDGWDIEVAGIPDFLIRREGGYVIRDVKISRRITEKDHPEILWQLRLYGWLFEKATGRTPEGLEVFAGTGEIVGVESVERDALENELARCLTVIESENPPFEPVGWSKCGDCGYRDRCWKEAEAVRDVALVPKADQGLVRALRECGIVSFDDLLAQYDEATLTELRRPWGKRMQKVGAAAAADVLRSARALATNTLITIKPPEIPESDNYVMFDLEGLPPQLDELEKIYLWGTQVYGERSSEFMAATAGFGGEGDRQGWEAFLENARSTFADYGDIPFVHWHHYERVKLDAYVERYGDPEGIAARVRANLFDLLPATQKAVAPPIPSYSLKVVEQYVGYRRTQSEYGGDWAMARYIEATETEDEAVRNEVMADILKYNEEDLAATWAVFCWVKNLGSGE